MDVSGAAPTHPSKADIPANLPYKLYKSLENATSKGTPWFLCCHLR